MKNHTLTALLILALMLLWGRLQDEQARADANAEKAKELDAINAAFDDIDDDIAAHRAQFTDDEWLDRQMRLATREDDDNE